MFGNSENYWHGPLSRPELFNLFQRRLYNIEYDIKNIVLN